jgi:hypothetical protein
MSSTLSLFDYIFCIFCLCCFTLSFLGVFTFVAVESHYVVGAGIENDTSTCTDTSLSNIIYGWAAGSQPLLLPENVGILLGSADGGYNRITIQIHYSNPNLVENVTDNSGVIFYYSTIPREHQAAMFLTGDPYTALRGQPVGNGLQEHSFLCPSTCSEYALQQEVTVLQTTLHMHKSGIRAYNEHIRNNEVIHRADAPFFDFAQRGNQAARIEPYTVQPGDSFRTVCQYNATNNELFGPGSQDEMCVSFLFYYPRQSLLDTYGWICMYDIPFPACATNHTTRSLRTVSDLERSFGTPMTLLSDAAQCQNPITNTSVTQDNAEPTDVIPDTNETVVVNPNSDDVSSPTVSSTSGATTIPASGWLLGILSCFFSLLFWYSFSSISI